MNTGLFMELFGYAGSILVVISMLMTNVMKLRLLNTAGCFISAIYSFASGVIPLVVMNLSIIIINVYNIYRIIRPKK